MLRTLRPFFVTLVCTWLALIGAALVYSKQLTHSGWILSAVLPAFLAESAFYLGSVFTKTREWFGKLPQTRLQGLLLWVSAMMPYVIFSVVSHTFEKNAYFLLAGVTGIFALWHAILPRRFAYDVGFLVIGAAPFLSHVFTRLYVSPDPKVHIDILGHLMWIRVGIVALLELRDWDAGPFGFWPTAREWRIGAIAFAVSIIPLAVVALQLHDVRYAPQTGSWWRLVGLSAGYFFGCLWVVALGEELFFRGVIEKALLNHWRLPAAAVCVSAVLYGAAHLWFRAFPNWPDVAVTSVLGITLGIVYLKTGSVRASMVTHAMVVTAWRMFFR